MDSQIDDYKPKLNSLSNNYLQKERRTPARKPFVLLSPHTSEAREQLSFIYIQNARFIVAVIDASAG